VGTEQQRPYRIDGGHLIFSCTKRECDVERWTLVWEKVRR